MKRSRSPTRRRAARPPTRPLRSPWRAAAMTRSSRPLLDRHASNRGRRRTVNDLQAEERLGACGLRGRDAFFAPRACQWRWRYARDARTTPAADALSVAFPPGPLVLDLGCGMGGSAIGLALNTDANVLAVDTSRACVRAARGFAKRLGSSCRFAVADAADALRWAATYEGPVYVLVQFPTPFALGGEATVRERRPFLLSRDVAELVTTAVGTEGAAYVASQVEDVALASADALESAGLRLEPAEEPVTTEAPKRLGDEQVGSPRRAVGGPWRATSPLPADAAPESEKRCELLGQPVHRFVASRRPRRGDRLRLFAAPRDDLDGGDDDADVVLDAALTRVMHAGTYEFVEDTSEPNRVFLGADGRATALRDIYDDSSGAGRGGAGMVDGESSGSATTPRTARSTCPSGGTTCRARSARGEATLSKVLYWRARATLILSEDSARAHVTAP